MTPRNILFVCTGNQCRSPMAEGLLKHLLGGGPAVTVSSCGTGGFIDLPATEEAVEVMKEAGVDISSHRSRSLTEELLKEASLVLVMSERHLRHIEMLYPGYGRVTYLLRDYVSESPAFSDTSPDIPDPIGKGIEVYRQVYAMLKEDLEKLAARLR